MNKETTVAQADASRLRRPGIGWALLIGGLTSLPVMAITFLLWKVADLPFLAFDLFDWLSRTLPGGWITFAIESMVSVIDALHLGSISGTAKSLEHAMALVIFLLSGAVLGGSVQILWRDGKTRAWYIGAGLGLAASILMNAIESSLGFVVSPAFVLLWVALVFVVWGASLGYILERLAAATTGQTDVSRRALLLRLAGGSIAVALAGWGLSFLSRMNPIQTGAGEPLPQPVPTPQPSGATAPPNITPTPANRERISPAPGTRAEITPNPDFYRIDIDPSPPHIDGTNWALKADGLINNPRTFTLSDLLAYPSYTQPITQSCISNPLGGDLISSSYWTGLRLRDLLEDLRLQPEVQQLYIESVDGFFESVTMKDMMDPRTLLVYGMNGDTLPVAHGFPLRIYIPNHYGMKQPKWITHIEAIDHQGPGYWVERGWSQEAIPHIVSQIDTIATDSVADGKIPVGGIAWAGDRGIQKVEVQVDDGAWQEAILRTPPLSQLIWVQWRYDWPMQSGRHTFRVRATDGTGALQVQERSSPHPDGATGYHEKTVTV
jgi:DMSO/TMAO reductase YedYZ molybdopterin-dependent catalytic subunit